QDEAPGDLPMLPALPGEGAEVGDSYVEAAGEVEDAAFDVAAALPRSLQRRVTTISANSARTVQLTFADGVVVNWGSPGSADEKATVVGALRERRGWGSAFTRVDVTAPEAPAWQ
ncbi:MAG: cell division protein FtsQ/DivIB, partial [Actinomycetia bacterium]|nr:cell division protein FtsQ/DivIB [Actinomycetes bacterium]